MKNLILLFVIALLSACSTPDPYQTEKGMIMEATNADKGKAISAATSHAKKHCKKSNQGLFLINRNVKYQGELSETAHNTMTKAGKIIDAAGHFAFMNGSSKAVHTGSATHSLKDNDAYIAKVLFKCQ